MFDPGSPTPPRATSVGSVRARAGEAGKSDLLANGDFAVVYTPLGTVYDREDVVRGTIQRIAEFPDRRGMATQVIWRGDENEGYGQVIDDWTVYDLFSLMVQVRAAALLAGQGR